MQLYSYFRSSAAYRVRIALNLKGLSYEYLGVHLLKNGGEQLSDSYRELNPAALVPTLVDGDVALGQSMAIIEYLDETRPEPPLLPGSAVDRARIRALAQIVACDIHPINNQRVAKYLGDAYGVSDEGKADWMRHWMQLGLEGYEAMLATTPGTGKFSHGDTPTLADICLIPQLFNAVRFSYDFKHLSNVQRIFDTCMSLSAFDKAQPSKQPDAF